MSLKVPYETFSQLSLSNKWGQAIGDTLCGPVCLYYLISSRKKRTHYDFKKFLKESYPDFLFKKGQKTGMYIEEMCDFFNRSIKSKSTVARLHRRKKQKNLAADTAKLLNGLLKKRKKIVLEIDCYNAKIEKNKNKWTRTMGHFVVLLAIKSRNVKNGYFEFEYWDPWNGKKHWGVIREEMYRDFAVEFNSEKQKKEAMRLSNSGHRVLSPYLCLEMPQLDMYDPKVYFAQRVVYLLKSCCVADEPARPFLPDFTI